MTSFTIQAIQNLISSDLSYEIISNELVRLFSEELKQKASENNINEIWAEEVLVGFWHWLTECDHEGTEKKEEELLTQMKAKLSQILNRCDSDLTLYKYIVKSIKNYLSRNKLIYAKFARAFYKKAREALYNDDRFVSVKKNYQLFFGLEKWADDYKKFIDEISIELENASKTLKEKNIFPVIQSPQGDSFISSKELSEASFRTLNHESFRFYCTLAVLFDLIRLTGQFGEMIPTVVNLDPKDSTSTSPPTPSIQFCWNDGYELALAFWKSLDDLQRKLLSYYIIPKADGKKTTRKELLSLTGFNNDVTMMNHEKRLTAQMEQFCKNNGFFTDKELYIPFMQALKNLTEDLKSEQSGHSYTTDKEDK